MKIYWKKFIENFNLAIKTNLKQLDPCILKYIMLAIRIHHRGKQYDNPKSQAYTFLEIML